MKTTSIPSSAKGISFHTVPCPIVSGYIRPATPRIKRMFEMFDPIALPIARSGLPPTAATMLTRSSGADVPNATIVRPITNGEILSLFAIEEAPLIIKSAPFSRITKPTRNNAYGMRDSSMRWGGYLNLCVV